MARLNRSYHENHVVDRAWRRCGMELGRYGYDRLLYHARRGFGFIGQDARGIRYHQVLYDRMFATVVYDPTRDCLLTVLSWASRR